MTVSGQAGGDFELGPASVAALVALGGSIDGYTAQLKRTMDRERDYYKGVIDVQIRAAGAMPATGSLYLGLDGPKRNRMRMIRRLVVGGVGWNTVAAGTAIFYIGSARPTLSTAMQVALSDVVDEASGQTTPLPSVAFYSGRQIVLHFPDQLFVEINGGTPGQTYAVGGGAEDWPDEQFGLISES